MNNIRDQPLPPGVQSYPQYPSNQAQPLHPLMPPPHHFGNPFGHQYEFRWPGNQTLQSSNPNYNPNVATQNFYMLPGQPPQLAHPGQNPCSTGQNLNPLQNFRDTFHTNQHVPVASYQQPDAGEGDSQQSSLHVTEEHPLGESDSTDRKISSHMSISKTSESGLIGSYIEKNHEIDQSSENEHLLRVANEHRAEMAVKRGKTATPENGNVDIGNGYGVSGGGAYHVAPKPESATPGAVNRANQKESDLDGESQNKPAARDLPEYLRQKLRTRGILKDNKTHADPVESTKLEQEQEPEPHSSTLGKLPSSWVETKDPTTGATYYYNENTGTSYREMPFQTSLSQTPQSSVALPEQWIVALDESSVLGLPQSQYLSWKTGDMEGQMSRENSKPRSGGKPPLGTKNKKDSRKRTYSEDDELDPMDPSSYSNASHGGWVVGLKGVQPRAADTTATGPLF